MRPSRYKVVETMVVSDDEIERIVNDAVQQGWSFDRIQFVMTEASKRPAMAFVFFTRDQDVVAENDGR